MSGASFNINRFTDEELALLKHECEESFYIFCKVMFKATTGRTWLEAPFHGIACETLTKVYNGEIEQLIVNIPPRYGKTWSIVVLWVAWCLAKAPWSRFFYTSYSDDLILKSSRYVKDIIQCELFQLFWGYKFRKDETAKKSWEFEENGGGLNAASVGGQVTGFGAGVTGYEKVFSGARIMDDPNKVQHAGSRLESENVQLFYSETFDSRKEHRHVPTIVVQQRTCEDDISAYLLIDGAHGFWHHLLIPALVSVEDEYPEEYEYGIPIDHNLPEGALWDYKHNVEELEQMRDNPLTEFKFWSQYQQTPRVRGGGMIKVDWLVSYDNYSPRKSTVDGVPIVSKSIYVDSAQKTGEHNDYSVFLCVAMLETNKVAVIDMLREKLESPDLIDEFKAFVYRHTFKPNFINTGLKHAKIEDKNSGTGLIQTINKDTEFARLSQGLVIEGIPRNTDKVSRMHGVSPHIKAGNLLIPTKAPWRGIFVSELTGFNEHGTAKHDDITDTVMDAIEDNLLNEDSLDYSGAYTA